MAFPQEVSSLNFHILDCGFFTIKGLFRDHGLNPQVAIHSDAVDASCEICMMQEDT